jgi:hypothetical protein
MVQSHFHVPTVLTIILRKVNLFATLSGSPFNICHFLYKPPPHIVAAVNMLQCKNYILITQWCVICRSWDGAISTVTKSWAGKPRKCGSICDTARDLFLLQNVHPDSWTHGTSYLIICCCEVDGAWSRPLISILCRLEVRVELYLDSSVRFHGMWRDVFKKRTWC